MKIDKGITWFFGAGERIVFAFAVPYFALGSVKKTPYAKIWLAKTHVRPAW